MVRIRPDAREKLDQALILVALAKAAGAKEILAQHLNGVERLLEMLRSSIEE